MSDLRRDDVTPYFKTTQLARKTKKYRRKVASPKSWAAIADAKQGPCRVCGEPPPNQLHHVVPRDRGGDDVAENIVPLCAPCHQQVENRNEYACVLLVESLWRDQPEPGARGGARDEYSAAVDKVGEGFPTSIYGITYRRSAA